MKRSLPLILPLIVCTAVALGQEAGPPPTRDMTGTWRVEGEDTLLGPYRGSITFTPRSNDGRYDYQRWVSGEGAPGYPERGVAMDTGSRLFLRQTNIPTQRGLMTNLGADELSFRQRGRHAIFRENASPTELRGVFMVPGTLQRGRETLSRVTLVPVDERKGDPFSQGLGRSDVELLIDGPEAYPAMRAAIENARSSINIQFFSWFDDETGRSMADLLRKKAREGVKVRVLMESFPQFGGIRWKIGPYMKEAGVEVIIHHTLTEGTKNSFKSLGRKIKNGFKRLFGRKVDNEPRESRGILNHDHRKIVVIDGGEIGFTGGMNIGNKYEQGTTWHDVHCSVVGPAATELERLFWDRWYAAGGKGEAVPEPDWSTFNGAYEVEVLDNLPGLRLDVTDRYLQETNSARNEILIENAYFLYDPMVNALKRKASQGVRTVVILPSNDLNDEALARDAFLWIENDVIRSGVELYKYKDRMSHGKVAVWDRRLSTVGTTNLDRMAMELNAEVNLFVPGQEFADYTYGRVFAKDIPASDRIQVGKLSWWERVKATVMHWMRGVL